MIRIVRLYSSILSCIEFLVGTYKKQGLLEVAVSKYFIKKYFETVFSNFCIDIKALTQNSIEVNRSFA